MYLTEKHIFKFNDEMDKICFETKNLYNASLYMIRKHFFETGKYLPFKELYNIITKEQSWIERDLPRRVCNHVLRLVDQNFKSFFGALKSYKKTPNLFKARPKIPKYKDKTDGRCVALYENGALNRKEFKDGFIKLSGTNIRIRTKVKNFKDIVQVRIVPKINHFVVEVIYKVELQPTKTDGVIASIDLGVNNLATITFSDMTEPKIINGKPLKSINQFHNKSVAHYKSKLKGVQKTSNKIQQITTKRNNKINDYLHKASRSLVNYLVSKNVHKVIIGLNEQWKQNINIGSRNNQNFVQIPHSRFIEMITYKANLVGITVITHEESYTSKCSFLDLEEVKKHEKYAGKRMERGLFKSSTGRKINADVNGSYNIMRKVVPDVFNKGIEGVAVHPSSLLVNR